ncbi:MAG: pyruvate ferredoxin oxidoreductase subunit gamma [Candidatus Omnitrophota bacterium]
MKEIRLHGRGGQGVVTAAEILATAAFFDGKCAQGFPTFGSERMGAPVYAFVRIDDKKIRIHSKIYNPDYIIVQDSTLIGATAVEVGLSENGIALINSEKKPQDLTLNTKAKIITIPATKLALEVLGKPIPNTVLLGAFVAITDLVSLASLKKAIMHRFSGEMGQKNALASEKAYEFVKNSR